MWASHATVPAPGPGVHRGSGTCFPYGETSFGSFRRKRFRFTGKERDQESGLTYHGARYYAPLLGTWISPDPIGAAEGCNGFRYARNNPCGNVDPRGTDSTRATARARA
jgi:RHS repeat-associated protein